MSLRGKSLMTVLSAKRFHRKVVRAGAGRKQRGLMLIEIMVAITVLSLGLFGTVLVQLNSLRGQRAAHMRAIAVQMSSDIAERMRMNTADILSVADSYVDPATSKYTSLIGQATQPGGFVAGAAQATHDMSAWRYEVARRLGPGSATGVVRAVPGDPLSRTVVVMWQERLPTAELAGVPVRGAACPSGDGVGAIACDPGCPTDGTVSGAPMNVRCVQIGVRP